jgi:hypothetical protein
MRRLGDRREERFNAFVEALPAEIGPFRARLVLETLITKPEALEHLQMYLTITTEQEKLITNPAYEAANAKPAEPTKYALFEGDRLVSTRTINGRYGESWVLEAADADKFKREYIPAGHLSIVQKELGLCEKPVSKIS